ncbi:MAG: hypothetical protein WBE26_01820 [Phycisphaerae bacterium]
MNDLTRIPYAQPVRAAVTRVPTEEPPAGVTTVNPAQGVLVRRRTDEYAVASAICGFTAIVPLVSQVIGLALGLLSLSRIRRARRAGIELAGAKWAAVGIFSSAFALMCWIGIFIGMTLLTSSFSHSAESLSGLLPPTPR